MNITLERFFLFVASVFYVIILSFLLVKDVQTLLALGYGIERPGHITGSPIGGFSIIRGYGFIILTLGLIISVILVNIKIRTWSYIAFCTFSLPLFFAFLYLELHNK